MYISIVRASSNLEIRSSPNIESIQTYGIDVYYMPRTQVNTDSIFGEDRISKFEDARTIEMYIKSVDGFEGDGTFVSNFGLEVRDQITFTVSRRRFQELRFEGDNRDKEPTEGDLVYFPLTESLFQIMHVQGYNTFYQTGALQTFDLVCELFEYSDEAIDTGIDDLDKIEREESYTIEFTLGSGSGTYNVGENVYQGTSRISITRSSLIYIFSYIICTRSRPQCKFNCVRFFSFNFVKIINSSINCFIRIFKEFTY
jgi:hypothetical protein